MMKRVVLFVALGCFLLSLNYVNASIEVDISVTDLFIPVEEKVELMKLTLSVSGSDNEDLESLTLDASGDLSFSGNEYSNVFFYYDTDGNEIYSSEDTLIDSSGSLNTNSEFSFSSLNQTISSENIYFLVITIDEEALGDTSTFTVVSVENEDGVETDVLETAAITATGLDVTFYDIAPSFVFPGQEDIALLYFIVEPDGEDLAASDEASLMITIDDTYGQFSSSTSSEDGVTEVNVYQSETSDYETYVTFNTDTNTSSIIYSIFPSDSSPDDWSETRVVLDENFTDIENGSNQAYWMVYQIGSDFLVSENTNIGVNVNDFTGVGNSSSLTLNAVVNSAGDFTSLPDITIPVAGVGVEDLTNEVVSTNVYGVYSEVTMLSFVLRSFQAPTTVNQINIINDGSVGFYTEEKLTSYGLNVWKVEIYQDEGTETFNKSSDTLVGKTECYYSSNSGSTCASDTAYVTVNIALDTYDSDSSDTNEEMFFVVYYLGSSFNTTADSLVAKAAIGNIYVSGNYSSSGITEVVGFQASGFGDDSPLSSSATANVSISEEVNLSIEEVLDISPDSSTGTVYAGEDNVDMLYLKIHASEDIDEGTITIFDPVNSLIGNGSGINKVWLYRDQDSSQTYSTGDTFVTNTNDFTDNNLGELPNVSFFSGINEFVVLYEVGQEADSLQASAQLFTISSESTGSTVTLAGIVPTPTSPAITPAISSPLLSSVTIDDSTSISSATTAFTVSFTVENSSGTSIDVSEIKPKFYLDGISGQDISYQFTSTDISSNDSETIADGSSNTYTFSIEQTTPYSDGTAIMDVYVSYTPTAESRDLVLERYEDDENSTIQILSSDVKFTIENELEVDESYGIFPVYIDYVHLERGSITYNFLNGGAVEEDDIMVINFVDASVIEQGSISFIRGTDIMSQISDLETTDTDSNYFDFNESDNTMSFYVGDETATVTIELEDYFGNDLDNISYSYTISSDIELVKPLFYPNPYPLGTNKLNLAFSVTQPSTVEIYIYNFIGVLVYSDTKYISEIGFIEAFEFDDNFSFMLPGIYICRLVAENSDGSQSIQTTKLAIY